MTDIFLTSHQMQESNQFLAEGELWVPYLLAEVGHHRHAVRADKD